MTSASPRRWTFLTNHGMVLVKVWQSPNLTVREVAEQVGITERATHRILANLIREGYISRRRDGRRNYYFIDDHRPMRHPDVSHIEVGSLLRAMGRER